MTTSVCFHIPLSDGAALGSGHGLDALSVRHRIEDEMRKACLPVDGGGMGVDGMDIFLIVDDASDVDGVKDAVAIGQRIIRQYGLTSIVDVDVDDGTDVVSDLAYEDAQVVESGGALHRVQVTRRHYELVPWTKAFVFCDKHLDYVKRKTKRNSVNGTRFVLETEAAPPGSVCEECAIDAEVAE